MTIKIEIKDPTVESAEIQGEKGKFTAYRQVGWVELPSGERRKVRVRCGKDGKGYPVGSFTISDESFNVSDYGDLELRYPTLVPFPVQPPAAPATLAGLK